MAITRRTWRRLAFIVVMKDSPTPVNTDNKNKNTGRGGLIYWCLGMWTKSKTYWLWQFGKIMIAMFYLLSTPNRWISFTADKSNSGNEKKTKWTSLYRWHRWNDKNGLWTWDACWLLDQSLKLHFVNCGQCLLSLGKENVGIRTSLFVAFG